MGCLSIFFSKSKFNNKGDIAKSTGPLSETDKNSGGAMRTFIVTVQLPIKKNSCRSPSMGNLMLAEN